MAMRMSFRLRLLAVLVIYSTASSVALAKKPSKPPSEPPPLPVTYHIYWLGGPSATTEALSVNASGTVVGYIWPGDGDDGRAAFVCKDPATDTTVEDLNSDDNLPSNVPGILRTAVRINNNGRIAGAIEAADGDWEVYAWDYPSGAFWTLTRADLAAVAECEVSRMWISDMNEQGDVLGGFDRPDRGGVSCFVWTPGLEPIMIRNLSFPDYPYDANIHINVSPSSLNNNGTIVGAMPNGSSKWYVFWWQLPDDPDDTLPGTVVFAAPHVLPNETSFRDGTVAINNNGVISAQILVKGDYRPAQYDVVNGNGWELLAGDYKVRGHCEAINNGGQICGGVHSSSLAQPAYPGFVYHPNAECKFWRLDDLTCDSTGPLPLGDVNLRDISDVDDPLTDWGTIVGYKTVTLDDNQSQTLGVVLIPE